MRNREKKRGKEGREGEEGRDERADVLRDRFCWIMIFSKETGKVVEIREYMNTALVKEVMTTN
jgi:ketosteroid isomerase-like protein